MLALPMAPLQRGGEQGTPAVLKPMVRRRFSLPWTWHLSLTPHPHALQVVLLGGSGGRGARPTSPSTPTAAHSAKAAAIRRRARGCPAALEIPRRRAYLRRSWRQRPRPSWRPSWKLEGSGGDGDEAIATATSDGGLDINMDMVDTVSMAGYGISLTSYGGIWQDMAGYGGIW